MCVDMYTRGLCRILGFGPKSDSQISMEMEKSALPGKYWLAYCELYPPNIASILLRNSKKKANVTYTLKSRVIMYTTSTMLHLKFKIMYRKNSQYSRLIISFLVFRHLGCVISCTVSSIYKVRWARQNEK